MKIEGVVVTEPETREFQEAGSKYYSGQTREGLAQLRALVRVLADPADRAGVLYWEIEWLLEQHATSQAREAFGQLNSVVRDIALSPTDTDEPEAGATLTVMARFAEAKVLAAEERDADCLQVLEGLVLEFPKQLTYSGVSLIRDELPALRGMALCNLGRWRDALTFLENAAPPETWRATVSHYLGRCYYEIQEYRSAERKLMEALEIGLAPQSEARARYVLGLTEYYLSKKEAAKSQFELSAKLGGPPDVAISKIWDCLELVSRELGFDADAEKYRSMKASKPN